MNHAFVSINKMSSCYPSPRTSLGMQTKLETGKIHRSTAPPPQKSQYTLFHPYPTLHITFTGFYWKRTLFEGQEETVDVSMGVVATFTSSIEIQS